LQSIPNPKNYFFTQTKYINPNAAVSAVRNPYGEMALVKVDLANGSTENLTPFSHNVMGYPFVKADTVYFSYMHDNEERLVYNNADKVFAVTLSDKRIFRVTDNINGVYHPVVSTNGEMLVSAFTAGGYQIAVLKPGNAAWLEIPVSAFHNGTSRHYRNRKFYEEAGIEQLKNPVSRYRKSFRLFNFHSWRPIVDDPEYGYSLFSDNVLSSFSNNITYTYNRADKSHTVGFNSAFSGWFPVLGLGVEQSFNRTVDTAFGKSVSFNAATVKAGVSIPLRFVKGRSSKLINFGGGYNMEQYYYRGVGKNILRNNAIKYLNAFLNFSNISQQARQHINPRWAQSVTVNYRDAVNFRNSHKFVAHGSFYFPGLFINHSLVINTAFQKRDTLPDLFSKVFSYARGYEALSTRRMYKAGVNYHFPIAYPDWGFANLLYFQRIRANAFFDYTSAKANVNNILTEIKNRSAGAEIYFDSKIWNALPVSFGVRFSHLLDTDLLNPLVKNRWEIIIPIGLIPD
jgi:hypothetical protein